MPSWLWLALMWTGFAGTHLLLSSAGLRPQLIARVGDRAFQGLYSLIVAAWLVGLIWVFATHKHTGPLLWNTIGPPEIAHWVSIVLMGAALALLVAGFLPSQAAPSVMGSAPPADGEAHGLIRITRHPFNAAMALFGVAHLFVNGHLGDVIFFGGFPLFAWIGSAHQDARLSKQKPGYRELVTRTSFVPFGALVTGRQRLVIGELPWAGFAAGLVLAVLIRRWHGTLFGP